MGAGSTGGAFRACVANTGAYRAATAVMSRTPIAYALPRSQFPGVSPRCALNALMKWLRLAKPTL